MSKRTNPYTSLLEECRDWARNVRYRQRIEMWTYPDAKSEANKWSLADAWNRVAAAAQLGYDTVLETDKDGGLRVVYVKRIPDIPWRLE